MNGDPLLIGVGSVFPNQNSSTAPTVWEEDTDQAAQQGVPCASGPMLQLIKRSSNQQFLPGGAVNPCPESAPFCLVINNLRQTPAGAQRLSAALVAAGLVGAQFIGGILGAAGLGVVGVGAPGDGVRGIAGGDTPSGHGVAGFTGSAIHAGVLGETSAGGIGVQGRSSNQAVRGDGGAFGAVGTGTSTGVHGAGSGTAGFGVVGRGTATGVDGTGTGTSGFGVVGRGSVAGVHGTSSAASGFGVIGIGGRAGVRGDGRGATSGMGVEGIPGPLSGGIIPWAGAFRGSVLVEQDLFVNGGLFVTGSPKAAVLPHPDGSERAMYAVESPESWLEDFGRARLRQGAARVEVDPDFAAVTGLGDDYHVFLTPEGPSNGLYVADRTPTAFEVREQADGTADVSFSYRIVTSRRDVRTRRLEPVERPPSLAGEPVDAAPEEPGSPSALEADEAATQPEAAAPPAEAERGAGERPPSGWPPGVPWPPDIATST
jgi:hypothetical protein